MKIHLPSILLFFYFLTLPFVSGIEVVMENSKISRSDFGVFTDIFILMRPIFIFIIMAIGVLLLLNECKNGLKLPLIIFTLVLVSLILSVKVFFFERSISIRLIVTSAGYLLFYLFCLSIIKRISVEQLRKVFLFLVLFNVFAIISHLIENGNIIEMRGMYQYSNPNHAGVGLLTILVFYLTLSDVNIRKISSLDIILLCITFVGILSTLSRTALLSFCVYIIARFQLAKLLALLAVAALLVNYDLFYDTFIYGRDSRFDLWYLRSIEGEYNFIFGFMSGRYVYYEGFYATLVYSLGVIGILLLFTFVYALWKQGTLALRLQKLMQQENSSLPIILMFATMLVTESVYMGLFTHGSSVFVMVVALHSYLIRRKNNLKGQVK